MKVLFAVNDENISTEIVKKYQKEYKEIISYKNVYFYNAILKEIQRDKTYDRIVISEDLEEFTSSSYEQRDKFIFEKLDEISDEALDSEKDSISIILICSERRTKADDILIKLFGIGIYNAIIGNDRSIDQVCKLINRPRSKKQAKVYYNIETDEVNYRPENESDVNEDEMRNIINHFKKLGKNEDQYVQSFRNIVSQYNEKQLKVIISVLPLGVKAVLEEKSPEYQKIATSNGVINSAKYERKKINSKSGPSEKLLVTDNMKKLSRPVIVPATMGESNVKTVMTRMIKPETVIYQDNQDDSEFDEQYSYADEKDFNELDSDIANDNEDKIELNKLINEEEVLEEKPKKRGRPRKDSQQNDNLESQKIPKKRGRPKKTADTILPGFEEELEEILPGIEDEEQEISDETNILPGFESNESIPEIEQLDYNERDAEENSLYSRDEEVSKNLIYDDENEEIIDEKTITSNNDEYYKENYKESNISDYNFDESKLTDLLTPEKKVIAFLGTTKNGTSFIVNSVAEVLAKKGVNVAILDATQNKNAYYIYTKNDESLRKNALNSYENLIMGNPYGVQVNQNLTVYTGIPSETERINNFGPILETLINNHTCVLIDCDFNTPLGYFRNVQELYLVQSMDVLTIQPLTAFLRELKSKNILDDDKINIVINKSIRLKGITAKNIIGGMAFYNDPEMSFMTELFDRNIVKYIEVPFNEVVYASYLSGIACDCEISLNSYPKDFRNIIEKLSERIYQLAPRKNNYDKKYERKRTEPSYANSFSSSMSNTLDNMKKKY